MIDWASVGKQSPVVGLSFLVVGVTLAFEGIGIFHGFSGHIDDVVLGRVLGTFDTLTTIVMTYWFGSTKSAHEKDNVIASQLNQPAPQSPPH